VRAVEKNAEDTKRGLRGPRSAGRGKKDKSAGKKGKKDTNAKNAGRSAEGNAEGSAGVPEFGGKAKMLAAPPEDPTQNPLGAGLFSPPIPVGGGAAGRLRARVGCLRWQAPEQRVTRPVRVGSAGRPSSA